MEQEIRSYEAQNKTGNEVLDTILTSKSLYCQQHGITLTCVADGAALDFMDTMDLCSLFGNALDNAIEGTAKVAARQRATAHPSGGDAEKELCVDSGRKHLRRCFPRGRHAAQDH